MSELREPPSNKASLSGGRGFKVCRWLWLIFTPILVAESVAGFFFDMSFLPGPLFKILVVIWLFASIGLLGYGVQNHRIGV